MKNRQKAPRPCRRGIARGICVDFGDDGDEQQVTIEKKQKGNASEFFEPDRMYFHREGLKIVVHPERCIGRSQHVRK